MYYNYLLGAATLVLAINYISILFMNKEKRMKTLLKNYPDKTKYTIIKDKEEELYDFIAKWWFPKQTITILVSAFFLGYSIDTFLITKITCFGLTLDIILRLLVQYYGKKHDLIEMRR